MCKKLLLIDDDHDDLEFITEIVHQLDKSINCIWNSDSENALRNIKQCQLPGVDRIFLDINMPRVTGKQLLYELKASNNYAHIPVIILSTSTSEKEIKDLLDLGASKYISKPTCIAEWKKQLSLAIG